MYGNKEKDCEISITTLVATTTTTITIVGERENRIGYALLVVATTS